MTDLTKELCPEDRAKGARRPSSKAEAAPAVPTGAIVQKHTTIPGLDRVHPPGRRSKSRPNFDPAKYLEQMADIEISQEEKAELLMILWDIMSRFVELGFGVDSLSIKEDAERTGQEETTKENNAY